MYVKGHGCACQFKKTCFATKLKFLYIYPHILLCLKNEVTINEVKNLYLFFQLYFIPFTVIPLQHNAFMPTCFRIFKTVRIVIFQNVLESAQQFTLNLSNRLETVSPEWSFKFTKYPEITRCQIRQIRWSLNDMSPDDKLSRTIDVV